MARWQDPYLPIITSCWRCLPGLLPPPPSQLRVDPLRAVLGKSLSAAGEECGGRAARASGAWGGGRTPGFHFPPAVIGKERSLVAAPGE